jgi:hypothetical protein
VIIVGRKVVLYIWVGGGVGQWWSEPISGRRGMGWEGAVSETAVWSNTSNTGIVARG